METDSRKLTPPEANQVCGLNTYTTYYGLLGILT